MPIKMPDEEISYEASGGVAGGAAYGAEPAAIKPEGTAAYIADITKELSGLARGSGLDTLAYLLDIAQLEASSLARRILGRAPTV